MLGDASCAKCVPAVGGKWHVDGTQTNGTLQTGLQRGLCMRGDSLGVGGGAREGDFLDAEAMVVVARAIEP